MPKQYWLIKSEPFKYAFADLVRDGKTVWDGIRSFEARNNLRKMQKGDLCLFYHSNEGKAVVGIAEVAREAFPDPTTTEDFSAVEIIPARPLASPVALDDMRADAVLGKMVIFRRQRLSVVPVSKEEFDLVLARGAQSRAAEEEVADEQSAEPAHAKGAAGEKAKAAAVPKNRTTPAAGAKGTAPAAKRTRTSR
jgi:predicted RNA-binding protein with PUA-like domain